VELGRGSRQNWSLEYTGGGTGAVNIPEQAAVAARQRLGLGIYFFLFLVLGWAGGVKLLARVATIFYKFSRFRSRVKLKKWFDFLCILV
jgi:hypothetical protein